MNFARLEILWPLLTYLASFHTTSSLPFCVLVIRCSFSMHSLTVESLQKQVFLFLWNNIYLSSSSHLLLSDQSSQLRHHFFREVFPKDFCSTLHFLQTPHLLLCKHIYLCHSIISVCLPSDLSSLKARTAVTTGPKRTRYDLGEQYTCIKSITLYHHHFIVTMIPPTLVRSKRKN